MHRPKLRIKTIISMLPIMLLLTTTISAAPKKNLWPRWQANNPQSTATIDNALWQNFLNQYVVTNQQGTNLVRYGAVTKASRENLQRYLAYLSQINIQNYNRNVQEAYWLNLYNALTAKTILKHYPVKSILKINISPGLFSFGPWDAKLIKVDGVEITLNDIEHRILRPIWNDPRIHYAVNCASIGCPNLQKQAYNGKDIDKQLTHAAEQYINSPRAIRFTGRHLEVSKIFNWYQIDFGGNEQGVIALLKKYAKPALKKKLDSYYDIGGYFYDWDLNGGS